MKRTEILSQKNCSKYGVLSMLLWNALLCMLILASKESVKEMLTGSNFKLIGSMLLIIIWSVIWYFIGYQHRKKYLIQKESFKADLPIADQDHFDSAYFKYHLSKNTKAISIVLFIAIPWYFIGYVQGNTMHMRDYLVVGILLFVASCLYTIHKKYRDTL